MKIIILALSLIFASSLAMADESFLQPYFHAEPVKLGEGKYYYKGLIHAYDAALFSASSQFEWNKPFAITLTYKTDIDGEDIADKSIEKINDIEPVDKSKTDIWVAELKKIIPDVEDGTQLSAIAIPRGIVFTNGGKKIGEIDDKEFARRFFEIWLSPKTSDQDLRSELLGEKK